MKLILDGNELPLFKGMAIKNEDAIATNRGQSGKLNVDRSFTKDTYQFKYDFFDLADYNMIKTLYDRQFAEGAFFRMQLIDSAMPLDAYVFITPQSIVPVFGGTTLTGYTLELLQR